MNYATISTGELARRSVVLGTMAACVVASTSAMGSLVAESKGRPSGYGASSRTPLVPTSSTDSFDATLLGAAFLSPSAYRAWTYSPGAGSDQSVVIPDAIERETSEQEHAIAEIRAWQKLQAGWDGESGLTPIANSLARAISFVCALPRTSLMPTPMLLASGRAALYWNDGGLYADLEFLEDGRVAYYIERGNGRHKGVVEFDGETTPALISLLLDQRPVAEAAT